jgi:hypothetical protein
MTGFLRVEISNSVCLSVSMCVSVLLFEIVAGIPVYHWLQFGMMSDKVGLRWCR